MHIHIQKLHANFPDHVHINAFISVLSIWSVLIEENAFTDVSCKSVAKRMTFSRFRTDIRCADVVRGNTSQQQCLTCIHENEVAMDWSPWPFPPTHSHLTISLARQSVSTSPAGWQLWALAVRSRYHTCTLGAVEAFHWWLTALTADKQIPPSSEPVF